MVTKIINIVSIILAILLIIIVFWLIYKQNKEEYNQNDVVLLRLKKDFQDFFNKKTVWNKPLDMLNNRDIMSEISLYRGNKSYTINKENIYICLKNEKGEYYNYNMLVYVLAHEIAHVLCKEIGHTNLFHNIFEELILHLSEEGVYNPSIPVIKNYCVNGDSEI